MNDNGARQVPGEEAVSRWSGRKYAAFAAVSLLLALLVSLGGLECFLRYHDRQIAHSEHMEPGLVGYHAGLGWQLTPGWSGIHHHHDYEVRYDIDGSGFRADPHAGRAGERIAVLGDSFTFGLGVANNETFVSRLNAMSGSRLNYLNLGVPGYSTDQEYLLWKNAAGSIAADRVLLVVYLGNDLFDNSRPFPLQADHAKPFFRLDAERRLALENTPVPRSKKPAAARNARLGDVVLGDAMPAAPLVSRTLGGLHIARHLGLFQQQATVGENVFRARLDGYIDLFLALAGALHDTAREAGADLVIALLPGPSFINHPGSLSAQYQDFLRRRLVAELGGMAGIKVIDLAAMLRASPASDSRQWYFPHEGHLTPGGHRYVAGLLSEKLGGMTRGTGPLAPGP